MNLRIKGGRSCFYQWDSGQAVIVEHEGTIHEVHFAHKGDKNAFTVITKEIENGVEANVPNILLQSSEDIFAYLVFRDEDGTETRKAVRLPVLSRPKPETYVYTETEVLNYNSLADRIDQIEQNGITGDQIAEAVEDYFTENPIEIPEGGTVVQADWNAKEGKPGHVLNRTHYTEHKKEYLADNVTFTKTANMQRFDWITYLKVENLKEVNVIFDGVEYVCPVKVVIDIHDGMDESYFSIGSTFGPNVNPDYPFGFFGYKGNDFTLVYADVGEHTISVYYDGEEIVHKLDPKYLPEVVTDEQIAEAVEAYLKDNPITGGGLDATIDGETLIFAESSTATIENETLIL